MDKLREELIAMLASNQAEAMAIIDERLAEKDKEWPQVGDLYFCFDTNGAIFDNRWSDSDYDRGRKAIGIIFRTFKDAEQDRDAKRVETELRSQAGRRAFVEGEINWCLDCDDSGLGTDWWRNTKKGLFQCYFESREAAQAALEAVGADRIKASIDWLATKEY